MKRKIVLSLVIIAIFSFNVNYNPRIYSKTAEIVSVELDKLHILEDRDFGTGEIYVKYIVNNGTPIYSSFYNNVIDGDLLDINLYLIANEDLSEYNLRVEIWESDNRYNEGENDFLGYVEYSKANLANGSSWFDAEGSIGGDITIQARLYIIETIGFIEIPTTKEDFISDNFYIIVLIALVCLFLFMNHRKNKKKKSIKKIYYKRALDSTTNEKNKISENYNNDFSDTDKSDKLSE